MWPSRREEEEEEEKEDAATNCDLAARSGQAPAAISRAQSERVRAGAVCPARLCSAQASCTGLWLLGPGLRSGPLPRPCQTRLLSFAWQPAGEDGEARAGDAPSAGGEVASEGQPLQNGLHAEGQGSEGVVAPPHKELPPGRAAPGAIPSKVPSSAPGPAAAAPKPAETPHPEAPKAAKLSCLEKSPKNPCPGGSPLAPAPAPSKGPQRCSKVPAKDGDAPKGMGPESTKKEKGAPPSHEQHPAKARATRELRPARKEPEEMKKDVGGGKKEPKEIKKPGKTTNKSEGPKGEPGAIQEKSEDVAKEVGKVKEELGEGKEAPGESKEETGESTDKDQVTCPQTCRAVTPCLGGHRCHFLVPCSSSHSCGAPGASQEGRGGAGVLAGSIAVHGASAVCTAQFSAGSCMIPLSPPHRPRGTFGMKQRRSGLSSRMDSRSVTCLPLPLLSSAKDKGCLQPGCGSGAGWAPGAVPAPCLAVPQQGCGRRWPLGSSPRCSRLCPELPWLCRAGGLIIFSLQPRS